jgi:hypothetical protein
VGLNPAGITKERDGQEQAYLLIVHLFLLMISLWHGQGYTIPPESRKKASPIQVKLFSYIIFPLAFKPSANPDTNRRVS